VNSMLNRLALSALPMNEQNHQIRIRNEKPYLILVVL